VFDTGTDLYYYYYNERLSDKKQRDFEVTFVRVEKVATGSEASECREITTGTAMHMCGQCQITKVKLTQSQKSFYSIEISLWGCN
jgi:hypothetical protein